MSIAEFVSCYSGYAESRGYPQLAQLLDDARHQAGDFDLADCHMKKYGPSRFCCCCCCCRRRRRRRRGCGCCCCLCCVVVVVVVVVGVVVVVVVDFLHLETLCCFV